MAIPEQQPVPQSTRRFSAWMFLVLIAPFIYVFSSGPVLATAFWLREATGWDWFYAVLFLYYPLLALGHGTVIGHYIEWWVNLFGTVGPG